MHESTWIFRPPHPEAEQISAELGIPPGIAQILVNRGITHIEDAEHFLFGTLDDLHDPFLMNGMHAAVDRIHKAVSRSEKMMIFGDYDVDGILSVVMLTKALKTMGADVEHYIPERLKDGYGIKEKYIDHVLERKAGLVISADCGTKAVEFSRRAKASGVDVIITDHHQPGSSQPEAVAILNPVLPDSGYPDPRLAGVGVAFKLIQALFQQTIWSASLPSYLRLVAIGTVADIAALQGENRILVKFGLKRLEQAENQGLNRLLEVCGLRGRRVSAGDVGYRIGPRINAAGRMGMTETAVRLFFAEDDGECRQLVQTLDKLNAQRQRVEDRIYDQAQRAVREKSLAEKYKLLVLGCEEWHRGVIGIVASKLKDDFHRPVLLFAYENGRAVGSGRSIKDFSLIDCLEANKTLLDSYGGHTMAVGCELGCKNMGALRQALNDYAGANISEDQLKKRIHIDARLGFAEIDEDFMESLTLLAPFGVGNPKPTFFSQDVEVVCEPRKLRGRHCKLMVGQDGRVFEALGWGRGDWADWVRKGDRLALVYSLQKSEYMGVEKLDLVITDLRKP